MNEIRRSLYEVKSPKKHLFGSKIKEVEKNVLELEESLFKPKKYQTKEVLRL